VEAICATLAPTSQGRKSWSIEGRLLSSLPHRCRYFYRPDVSADAIPGQFVLVVELEIDPSQLEPFKAAIKENGETAVRVEPGCRGFSAVFEKDNPTRVRLFEIYENADAFKAHLETPHFKKYAETTKDMVKSRKRIDNVPITLNVKGK
jgi:quinol monooxygenase YgiN